jgi:hypothetical protein
VESIEQKVLSSSPRPSVSPTPSESKLPRTLSRNSFGKGTAEDSGSGVKVLNVPIPAAEQQK